MPRKTAAKKTGKGAVSAASVSQADLKKVAAKVGKELKLSNPLMLGKEDDRFTVPYWLSTGAPDLDQRLGGGLGGGKIIEVFSHKESEGKCLALETPIIKADGEVVSAVNIAEGDFLHGPDGINRKVLSVTRGRGPLYRISPFKNGDPFYATANHVLPLKIRAGGDWEEAQMTVSEYLVRPEWWQKRFPYLFKSAPVLQWDGDGNSTLKLPIDPYYVGLWLGDGTRSKLGEVTNVDDEIVEYLHGYAASLGMVVRNYTGDGVRWNITKGSRIGGSQNAGPLIEGMRELGLHVTGKSRIPSRIMMNDWGTRMACLAGLVDSDGYLLADRQVEITTKSETLADDVVFLARSVGLAASVHPKFVEYRGSILEFSRIRLSGVLHDIPTKILRKRAKPYKYASNPLLSGFNVELSGVDDWVGIEVDGDHLFCLGDFTVTHNSSFAATVALNCQRAGGVAVYFDMENSIIPSYFAGFGLDLNMLVLPDFEDIDTIEAAFGFIETWAHEFREVVGPEAPVLFILDSVAAAQTAQQKEMSWEEMGVAAQARVMSNVLRKVKGILRQSRATLLLINQCRTKISTSWGDPNVTPGGRAMKYYAHQRIALRAKRINDEKDKNLVLGIEVEAHVVKNKLAPPWKKSSYQLFFGQGVDWYHSAFELLLRKGALIPEKTRKGYYKYEKTTVTRKTFPELVQKNSELFALVGLLVHESEGVTDA